MAKEDKIVLIDQFDNICPEDYRYRVPEVLAYLSENGFTKHKLLVEVALLRALAKRGLCPQEVVDEVEKASVGVRTAPVYAEEENTRHDVRALVNVLGSKVSDRAKPFIHTGATSYDIVDSANALRMRGVTSSVVLPALRSLEKTLLEIAEREAGRVQIGRTHGQHAVPITFGFAIASYVDRLGNSIREIESAQENLRGKFSGAVGAYNATSLFFRDPEEFEREVLAELGLEPAEHSSQIVPPEPMIRLVVEIAMSLGIMANLSRDMRNLQRTEIAEVGEDFDPTKQVGSSTMTQKRNPVTFENVEGAWKIVSPRLGTLFLDQVSEHQRDLTNSITMRTYGSIINYVVYSAKRLNGTMKKLKVDGENMDRNLGLTRGLIAGEPLYILLAQLGHPNAHEASRRLAQKAQAEREPFDSVVFADKELEPWLAKMTHEQRELIKDPRKHIGIAPRKTRITTERWRKRLAL